MYPVELSSSRLTLRELRLNDVDGLVQVYGDAEAVRHLSFTPRTKEQCVSIIDAAVADAQRENRGVYMLGVAREDRLVGAARLAVDEWPHSAQIGFALRPDLWGQGLGGELVGLLLRFGFKIWDSSGYGVPAPRRTWHPSASCSGPGWWRKDGSAVTCGLATPGATPSCTRSWTTSGCRTHRYTSHRFHPGVRVTRRAAQLNPGGYQSLHHHPCRTPLSERPSGRPPPFTARRY
ncbi:GNAT family N-acetyltransferase [Nocardiopsis sp. Huas11]|uniref:GNAT family N-acetyltransferase n=1 Tax=Nocardiopsis sp. Huas11 TaxID=2183912 RepID=UPI001F387CEB|nr:GNAT family N-acetyltransferase [Nocardiopsis sp. Huas11]